MKHITKIVKLATIVSTITVIMSMSIFSVSTTAATAAVARTVKKAGRSSSIIIATEFSSSTSWPVKKSIWSGATSSSSMLLSSLRGGGGSGPSSGTNSGTTATTPTTSRSFATTNNSTTTTTTTTTATQYQTLSDPAPGSPFHHAFPVHDLEKAKEFYGTVLGCQEGRSSEKWQDYSLHGHQIVAHWVGNDYRCQDYYNPVDGDEVPVPHMGLALTVDQFHELAARLKDHGIQFIIEPTLRFEGRPGEQYTMFFKDPSGNNLEFKAMTHPENLFAKYNVPPE